MIKVAQVCYTSLITWNEDGNQIKLSQRIQIFFNPALLLTDGGDMDARDYVRMRFEKRLREGLEDGSGSSQSIGSFERFTKVRRLPLHTICSQNVSYSLKRFN